MELKEIKARIAMLDKIADDESISNEEFNAINVEIADLYKEVARLEAKEQKQQIKKINHVSSWYAEFLASFDAIGTRKVTNKQAYYLQQVNHGQPFVYNGKIYSCFGPNYRVGFGTLTVENF